jgi:hypothetical protein
MRDVSDALAAAADEAERAKLLTLQRRLELALQGLGYCREGGEWLVLFASSSLLNIFPLGTLSSTSAVQLSAVDSSRLQCVQCM